MKNLFSKVFPKSNSAKLDTSVVSCRRDGIGWELLYVKEGVIMLTTPYRLLRDLSYKHFETREEIVLYCDIRNLQLVSLQEFNKHYELRVTGDEC